MSERVPENFIPWEQIEPLVGKGMTGRDVAMALIEAVGLPTDGTYNLTTIRAKGLTLSQALHNGLHIIKGRPAWHSYDDEPAL